MRISVISFALVMTACTWQLVAAEPTEQQQFTLKQSAPSVGSNLRLDIIKAGVIPLDKRYDELTLDQKNTLKSVYEKMSAADEPPYPAHGLMPIVTMLGKVHETAELKYKGPLTLYVSVDSAGKAKSVSVVDSPDPEISKAAAYALMSQTYKPAICNGAPCAMEFPFHVELIGPEAKDVTSFGAAAGFTAGVHIN